MVHTVRRHMRNGRPVRSYTRRDPGRKNSSSDGPVAAAFTAVLAGVIFFSLLSSISAKPQPSARSWTTSGVSYRTLDTDSSQTCQGLAYGETADFLAGEPCSTVTRGLYAATRGQRAEAIVAVSWTTMQRSEVARELRHLVDQPGTGNVTELTDNRNFTG